jgi:hypothetical protein
MAKHSIPRALLLITASTLSLTAVGCADPQSRYDAFQARTVDLRSSDAGAVAPGERFDFSGRYLLALAITISSDSPLLFACDVSVASDLTTLDLQLRPLSTDSDAEPRTPVGDTFGARALPYAEDGTFSADLGEVTAPGRANPISGSTIVANVSISASTHRAVGDLPNLFCGQASGMVNMPLTLDLAGSTFGAIETTSFTDAQPLTQCPE